MLKFSENVHTIYSISLLLEHSGLSSCQGCQDFDHKYSGVAIPRSGLTRSQQRTKHWKMPKKENSIGALFWAQIKPKKENSTGALSSAQT